ncbi:MAG: DUF4838 domain-containing protein [Planctomycetota bacterium]|nr:DUF4838 domain-containing protein [Planctomycetota bacterium]
MMHARKKLTVVVVLAGVAILAALPELRAEDLLTIARDGKTQYTIVHADPTAALEKQAVQELGDFLGRVTGAAFPVVAESSLTGEVRGIYVGWTKFSTKNGIETSRLGEEEWVIRSAGENLILTGGRPRGTLYAVYEFLEQQVGCHWLARDTEIVPDRPTLEFPKPSVQAKPHIWMRDIYTTYHTMLPTGEMARRHREFLMRNKHSVDNHQVYGSPGGCHTFFQYLNARDWFETHPEYFSLVDGKRLPATGGNGPGQLCLTHPDVRRIVVERLRGFIQQDREKAAQAGIPPPRIYDISQNDAGAAECQCENCQAIAKREGSESGPMIDFINAIADSVKDEYPEILLQTFAYNRTEPPPKTLKPRANVIVRWCDVYSVVDLVRPLNHPSNAKNYGEILAWGKLAPHLAVWDYWISYGYYHFPTPYCMIQCIGPDLKLFVDMHAETMFCESEEDHEHGENFTALKYWLGYKLMVNPDQPVEPLIHTFLAGYFGAAAPRLADYLKYLQARIDKEAEFLLVRNAPHRLQYLDVDFFRTADTFFAAAEALVKPHSLDALHVQRERLVVDGALLYLWPWLDRRLAATETMPFDHETVIRRYETNWRAQFKAFFSEQARAMRETKITRLAALFRDPKLPEPFQNLPPRQVADFNWLTFSPYSPGRQDFVADAEAAGGTAAAFVADSDDAQKKPLTFGVTGGATLTLKPEDVPQDGRYHVFKIGRVKVKQGTTVWAHASRRLGVNVDRLVVAEANDPTANDWDVYISLKVKGPDYAQGSTDSNGLWLDRVLLVKPPKEKIE